MSSFYVDNSYSMQNESVANRRYIDMATSKLDELLGLFP